MIGRTALLVFSSHRDGLAGSRDWVRPGLRPLTDFLVGRGAFVADLIGAVALFVILFGGLFLLAGAGL